MLKANEQIPHFTVTTLDGARVAYTSIWQRRNLVLIALPASGDDDEAVHQLVREVRAAQGLDAEVLATRDVIEGIEAPAIVVADRWGEINHVDHGATLPSSADVIAWVEYVQQRCPECEGETR
jgi:hypothetical protein